MHRLQGLDETLYCDWMKHCTEKLEGTCQKMYNDCLEIQTTNYVSREK